MATIQSGVDSTLLTVDPESNAARVTLYDSAGNEIMKAPAGQYVASISVRHTAASAAGTTMWAMRNGPSPNTKTVKIKRIKIIRCFDGTAAAATTVRWAVQRYSGADFTGGTALSIGKKKTTHPTSAVTTVRQNDTGLTAGSVTFEGLDMAIVALPVSATATVSEDDMAFDGVLNPYASVDLLPGEGICIRLATAAVIGAGLYGMIAWDEVT